MIQSFSLFNYDCRWVFIDGISEGVPFLPDELIGRQPWAVGGEPDQVAELEKLHTSIVRNRSAAPVFGLEWNNGCVGYWYQVKTVWLGLDHVAYAMHAWQFTHKIGRLTDNERNMLIRYGHYRDAKDLANTTFRSQSTIYGTLQRIREKLGIDAGELATLAARFSSVSK